MAKIPRELRVGEQFPTSASFWNPVIRGAVFANLGDAQSLNPFGFRLPEIENQSGSDVEAFGILEITGPAFEPTPATIEVFEEGFDLAGDVPGTNAHNIAVLLAGVPDGDFAPFAATGIVQVDIDLQHVAHDYCQVINGDSAKLQSATSGWRIVWRPGSTGTERCLVNLSERVANKWVGVADGDIDPDSTGTVTIWKNGFATSMTETAHLDFWHKDEKISDGKEVGIRWYDDEGLYRIENAECE